MVWEGGQNIVHTQWVPPPPPNSIVNLNVPPPMRSIIIRQPFYSVGDLFQRSTHEFDDVFTRRSDNVNATCHRTIMIGCNVEVTTSHKAVP